MLSNRMQRLNDVITPEREAIVESTFNEVRNFTSISERKTDKPRAAVEVQVQVYLKHFGWIDIIN